MNCFPLNLPTSLQKGIFISIFQIRKLTHRESKGLARGHIARKLQGQDLGPGREPGPLTMVLPATCLLTNGGRCPKRKARAAVSVRLAMGAWRSCPRKGHGSRGAPFALNGPLPQQAVWPLAEMNPRLPHALGGLPTPLDTVSSAEKAHCSSSGYSCSFAHVPSNYGVCYCVRRCRSLSLEINRHDLCPLVLAIWREEGQQAQSRRDSRHQEKCAGEAACLSHRTLPPFSVTQNTM